MSTTHEIATSAALVALCQGSKEGAYRCSVMRFSGHAGGNAADAVAVAQFVLNVVQPQSTGVSYL